MIFGSVCEMYCTKKITPGKNFSFSLHEQDQGAWFAATHAFCDLNFRLKVGTNVNSIHPTQDLCMHPAALVFVLILSQGTPTLSAPGPIIPLPLAS